MGGDFLLLLLLLHHFPDVALGQHRCYSCSAATEGSCEPRHSAHCLSDSGSDCHSTFLLFEKDNVTTTTTTTYMRGCWNDDVWLSDHFSGGCVDGCFRLDNEFANGGYACVSCCTGNLCNDHTFFEIDNSGKCPTDGPLCASCDNEGLTSYTEPYALERKKRDLSGSGSGQEVPDTSIRFSFTAFHKLCDCVCTNQEENLNQRLYPYGIKQGDTALQRYLDGVSDPITIDIEFPFFDKIYKIAYVGTNGIVSLGKPFYFWWPHYFPGYGWIRRRSVVAPFWADVDIRQDGNVWYQVYTEPEDLVLWRASRDVQKYVKEFSKFEAKWVLVATWDKVPNYPDGCTAYSWGWWWWWWSCYNDEYTGLRNTFQAVLATDGLNSFAIFNYNADDMEWSGRWSEAVIGYNVEHGSYYDNNKLSETDQVKEISRLASASNVGKPGKIVYRLSLHPSYIAQAKRNCRVWYYKDKREHDLRWVETLEPCPCRWWQAWWDRRFRFDWYSLCAYSIFESSSGSRQECCYSDDWFAWGSLIVGAPYGGAAERYHPDVDQEKNYEWDEKPYKECCGLSKLCHLYYERRPSDDCSAYEPPVWAWFWGDPHISTLDGQQYTFNGWGEYIVMKTVNDTFVLQGRTQPTAGSSATVFSAFSMAEFPASNNSGFQSVSPESDVLHVQLTLDNFFMVKHQSVASANQSSWSDLTANFTALDNTTSITLHKVFITRPSNSSLVASFPSGVSVTVEAKKGLLAVVFAAPSKLRGETRGLLGAWDGNKENELVFRNGSLLQGNATDRQIHEFGQSWQIIDSESLFYYQRGENASTFSYPNHVPLFPDEIPLSNFTQEQIDACGGDSACLYDYLQTNDPEIAMQTKGTSEENTALSQNLANNPPRLFGNSTFRLHANITASFTFTVSDPNDTYTVTLMGNLPPPEDYTFSRSDNEFNFTWTPSTLSTVRLVFIANDSSGAISVLHPEIHLCACPLDLNATCIDSGDDGGEDRFILQDCQCGSGWEGQYCDEDIDGCEEINCFDGVECFDYPPPLDGAECGPCPDGTISVADKCIDVNECNGTANGGCAQKCVNELYSFHCECNAGYHLVADNTSCTDADECTEGNPCHQLCNNTEGSFFCDCVEGFKLDPDDNRTCEPKLVCSGTQSCKQHCAEIHGKPVCYCDIGFEIGTDKFTCSDIDECSDSIDNCDQLCLNTNGSFSCSCRGGYRLSTNSHSCQDVNECIDLTHPCNISGQICVNSPGTYSCHCPLGTVQINDTCQAPLVPVNTADMPTRSVSTSGARSGGTSAATPTSVSTIGRSVSGGTLTTGNVDTTGKVDTETTLPLGILLGTALGAAGLVLVSIIIFTVVLCKIGKSKRSSKVIPITNVRGEPPRAVRPQKIEMVQYTRHGAELTEVSA